jgi:hypothetical protein
LELNSVVDPVHCLHHPVAENIPHEEEDVHRHQSVEVPAHTVIDFTNDTLLNQTKATTPIQNCWLRPGYRLQSFKN